MTEQAAPGKNTFERAAEVVAAKIQVKEKGTDALNAVLRDYGLDVGEMIFFATKLNRLIAIGAMEKVLKNAQPDGDAKFDFIHELERETCSTLLTTLLIGVHVGRNS